jgi:hypothetical protein
VSYKDDAARGGVDRVNAPGAARQQRAEAAMDSEAGSKTTIAHKVGHELKEYAIVFAYLYVCFSAVILYKASVLTEQGISYAPWGFAAVKALILGKFMLIGNAMHLGQRLTNRPLIYPTLRQSFIFLVFLLVLLSIEETLVGLLHGRTVVESLSDVAGAHLYQILATCLLMFLILLPYFAFRQLAGVLGEGRLSRLFFVSGRRPDPADPTPEARFSP